MDCSRTGPSSKPVTALSAARFLKTLAGDEGHAGAAPSRHTPAQMKKFFEMTHGAHRVRVLKCSGAEKGNLFLKRVSMDVDLAIEGEVADDGDVVFLECDCEGFFETNNLCVHVLLVAEYLGLCDIKALSGSCGAGRQGPGHKRATPKALSKDARVGGVPSTHTAKHWITQFLVRKPGYWMKSHVARKFGDGD